MILSTRAILPSNSAPNLEDNQGRNSITRAGWEERIDNGENFFNFIPRRGVVDKEKVKNVLAKVDITKSRDIVGQIRLIERLEMVFVSGSVNDSHLLHLRCDSFSAVIAVLYLEAERFEFLFIRGTAYGTEEVMAPLHQ